MLRGYLDRFCTVYLDDILIFSRSVEEHAHHLELVLKRLNEHGLHAKRSKCHFGLSEIEYLGHKVSHNGIEPHPEKVAAVKQWPTPTSAHDV